MCIILLTTKKLGLPTDDTLNHIFDCNPDGAGLACVYTDADTKRYIVHQKGIMKKSEFLVAIKEFFAKLTTDEDYLVSHTRIATHGGVSSDKTHPFKTPAGDLVFHNGICTAVTSLLAKNESDTEYVANHYTSMEDLKRMDTSSRYLVIHTDGTYEKSGLWIKDPEGREWSNGGYQSYVARYTKYGSTYGTAYDYSGYDNYGTGYYYKDDYQPYGSHQNKANLALVKNDFLLNAIFFDMPLTKERYNFLSYLYDKFEIKVTKDLEFSIMGITMKMKPKHCFGQRRSVVRTNLYIGNVAKTPLFKIVKDKDLILFPTYDDTFDLHYQLNVGTFYDFVSTVKKQLDIKNVHLFETKKKKKKTPTGTIYLDSNLNSVITPITYRLSDQALLIEMFNSYFDIFSLNMIATGVENSIIIDKFLPAVPTIDEVQKELYVAPFPKNQLDLGIDTEFHPFYVSYIAYLDNWIKNTSITSIDVNVMDIFGGYTNPKEKIYSRLTYYVGTNKKYLYINLPIPPTDRKNVNYLTACLLIEVLTELQKAIKEEYNL